MTAIAYRDGIMAADSLSVVGNLKTPEGYEERKLFAFTLADGMKAVAGIAGESCPENGYIVSWLSDNHIGELPSLDGDFTVLVATEDGRLMEIDHHGYVGEIKLPFYAIGVGAEICIGFMEAGGDPINAVNAAIKWSPKCGGKTFCMVVNP